MSLPTYDSYKPSNVDWLGSVPSHWRIERFRHIFRESPEKIDDAVIGPMLSVSGYRGVEVKEYDDENRRRLDEELIGYRIVRPGQLVVNTMWLNYSGLGVSEYEGHVSPAYRSYWISGAVHSRFIHHLLRSSLYVKGYTKFLTGIRPNSLQMSRDDLMVFPVLLPPMSEQKSIATFLDEETSKIDALVVEQQRLIELLKAKRQAVITQVVTKGLNPNVPMKDSGVEWLGSVPAHWTVSRMKAVLSDVKAGPFGSALTKDMYVESGYRVYGQEQVIPDDFSLGDYYVSEATFSEMEQYAVRPSDVLLSCVGTFGRVSVVPDDIEPGIINPRLIRLRCESSIDPLFLATVLRSAPVFEQFSYLSRGGTMDTINIGTLSSIVIPVPSVEEQLRIVRHLADSLKQLDELTLHSERSMSLLNERRSALISAATTGKIDVSQTFLKNREGLSQKVARE
jgi:type I restriction enzyme S subunit